MVSEGQVRTVRTGQGRKLLPGFRGGGSPEILPLDDIVGRPYAGDGAALLGLLEAGATRSNASSMFERGRQFFRSRVRHSALKECLYSVKPVNQSAPWVKNPDFC